MKIFGDGHADFHGMGIADMAIGRDHDGARGRSFGDARDQKSLGADDNGSFKVAKVYFRTVEFVRPQARAGDAEFASGERQRWRDHFNAWSTVDVLSAEDAVGKSHEEVVAALYEVSSPKCSRRCIAANAKIPAATSSSTIPVPSGSFSSCRTGGGLTMSNALKSIRLARKVFHASGTAISAISCPATSSMTTNCGSFAADARATRVAAGMPTSATRTARAMATGVRSEGVRPYAMAAQITTVAAEAQVPGPGCRRPIPKKVATVVAQSGARGVASGFTPRPRRLRGYGL